MAESHTYSFKADLDALHPLLSWVREHIIDRGFSEAEVRKIELAIEEVFINIIHHACLERKGMIEITCTMHPHQFLTIILKDYGIPFNPLESGRKIDPQVPLNERKAGGLGISLIRQLVDKLEYKREGDANILLLTKYCAPPSSLSD
jgi:serine/threonine-protein kinase RsbW